MATFDEFSLDYQPMLDRCLACSGEGSEYFAAYKARYILRLLGAGFEGKLLDYGCGVGLLARFLKQCLPRAVVHGYDVSKQSLERVDEGLRAAGLFSSNLGEIHRDYALVVISNVIHHVPPSGRQRLLSEVAGRLKLGGRIVVFEHNPWNPITRWIVRHCAFDADAVLLRSSEASLYLAGAGLSIARRDYLVFFPRALAFVRKLEPVLSRCPLGAQYAVVGERNG